MTADEVIAWLGLEPHPEGGQYVQTFADAAVAGRAHSTAIYFLLRAGERSHWHRVDAAETWHYYAGAPMVVELAPEGADIKRLTLGPDLAAGQRPQGVVPAHVWQAASSTGEWTLVGCTVAPGFHFGGFELAKPGWSPPGA